LLFAPGNKWGQAPFIILAVDSLKEFVELAPDDPQAENIKNLIPKLEELIKDN